MATARRGLSFGSETSKSHGRSRARFEQARVHPDRCRPPQILRRAGAGEGAAEVMFERAATRSAELAGERAPYTILARGRVRILDPSSSPSTVGPEHHAAFVAHVGIGVALLWRGDLVRARARAELEQGPDPTVATELSPRSRWRWALGATALGILELREGELEAGRTRIEQARTDLRDADLRDPAERELARLE